MAKKVFVVDDLDPDTEATHINVEITYDGATYRMDLGDDNKKALDDALAPFLDHAQKVSTGKPRTRKRGGARGAQSTDEVSEIAAHRPVPQRGVEWWHTPAGANAATQESYRQMRQQVRQWARENGWELGARGRVPKAVYEAWYEHEHAGNSNT